MDEKTWIRKIKLLGAVLLALAFLLPISRCEKVDYSVSEEGVVSEEAAAGEKIYDYSYAYENISLEDPGSLLIPVVFFWPWLVLAYVFKGKNEKNKIILNYLSIPLSGGSIYAIFAMTILGELYIGAYVGIAGASLFLVAAFIEATMHISTHLSRKNGKP